MKLKYKKEIETKRILQDVEWCCDMARGNIIATYYGVSIRDTGLNVNFCPWCGEVVNTEDD